MTRREASAGLGFHGRLFQDFGYMFDHQVFSCPADFTIIAANFAKDQGRMGIKPGPDVGLFNTCLKAAFIEKACSAVDLGGLLKLAGLPDEGSLRLQDGQTKTSQLCGYR